MLREEIIYILEKNRGEFVSGQYIAEQAGVSRSAVAKCVTGLKNEGFPISSVNNLGHCLDIDCDILSTGGVKAHLSDDECCTVKVFKSIDSTNTEAKRAVVSGLTENAIFAADEQTAGRGRRGRNFYSPDGSGLYFSVVLHPEVELADSTALTSAAAVAVTEALRAATKKDPKIKWVNDIFIDGRKVCGILTEAVCDFESGRVQAVIIGIGINLTTRDFPAELENIAGSLGTRLNRCELIAQIFQKLKAICEKLPNRDFMNDYRRHSLVIGKTVTFNRNGVDYTAVAKEIADDGTLAVITDSGEEIRLNSGEISVKLK